jgi:hypothetical protein
MTEHNASLLDAQDALVRDLDAMRVGAEAGGPMLGAYERRLRVDDPVATAQLVAVPRNGRVVVELSAFEDLR